MGSKAVTMLRRGKEAWAEGEEVVTAARETKVAVLGLRAMVPGRKVSLRAGQKPYALPAAIGSIPAGTVIGVDQDVPDTILDRLNMLPLMDCITTCAGGHRTWHLHQGVEQPAPALKGPKWELPAVLYGRSAKVGFYLLKTGDEKPTRPGKFTLPDVDAGQYLIYPDAPYLWIVAPFFHSPSIEWWEGLCQILEGARFVYQLRRMKKAKGSK